jgi:predicted O-methyltransferase YrrM
MMNEVGSLRDTVIAKQKDLRNAIEAMAQATKEPFIPWAPSLNDAQLANCRVLPSRNHILDHMPKGGVCAEVGTQAGHFAKTIWTKTLPTKLHIIDMDLSQFQQRDHFKREIGSGQVVLHEGSSSKLLDTFPDNYFDWIYIDADHSYEGFCADLGVSAKKLKANGLIVCNDYAVWSPSEVSAYGVLKGIHEFCLRENWEFLFLGLHGQGYHDVCLTRRGANS